MKRKVVLSKILVAEYCRTHPSRTFSIDDISKSIRADGISGFTRAAITAQLANLARTNVIKRVSMGRYERCHDSKPETKIDNKTISMAQIGKSMYCYMKLLEVEVAELKRRLGDQEVVNIRDLTGGRG